ncbi:TolC family outer membrane protein [Chitiniphilus eburneus]|nr:TolC family outer membrane protein [Chitiniphilus eburneus]
MNLKKSTLLAGVVFAITSQAYGETLADAVEKAVLRNPDVKARWYDFRASGEDVDIARGGYYPRIDVQGAVGKAWRDDPNVDSRSYSNPTAGIELRQMLFDGFATRDEVRRLNYAKLTRYYELLSTSDSYAMDTVQAYYDVLRYRELVKLAEANHNTHKDIFKLIEQRTQAGVGRRVDLEQAAGRLALAESNLLTERSNLYDVSARYTRLVGEEPVDLDAPPDLAALLPGGDTVLPQAIKNNPSFLAAISNIRSARAGQGVARAAYWPTVDVRASQGYERNQDGVDGSYRTGRLMLMLNYNLFKGGSDRARERRALEDLNGAFELRDKACRDIRQTTQIAWNNVQRLGEQITYLEQHELSTRKARDAYRQQFEIGQRTLLDVLDTENELFDAARSLVSGRVDRKIAEARVLAQTHQLLAALKLAPLEAETDQSGLAGSELEDEQVRCNTVLPPSSSDAGKPMASAADKAPPAVTVAKLDTTVLDQPPAMIAEASAIRPTVSDETLQMQVFNWASAWASKDVKRYLAYYGSSFKPEGAVSRDTWEADRIARLAVPTNIRVEIHGFTVTKKSANAAEVKFVQAYETGSYRDRVTKTLVLMPEKDQWKIVRERVMRA